MKKFVSTLSLMLLAVSFVGASSASAHCYCGEVDFGGETGEIRLIQVPHDHPHQAFILQQYEFAGWESRNQALFNCDMLLKRHDKCRL